MIDIYVALQHKVIPFSEWKGRIAGGVAIDEVGFSCLDGAFGNVAEMVLWGHALKCDVVLPKEIF